MDVSSNTKNKKYKKNPYINQLFKVKPNKTFVENLVKLVIPTGFDEHHSFSKETIIKKNVLEKIQKYYFMGVFRNIYMPCKFKKQFANLNEKKFLTIFRQILKLYNYKLASKEICSNGIKKLFYNLKKINNNNNNKIPTKLNIKSNTSSIVKFD